MVPARLSLVTLGVADLERSVAFYTGLGWEVAVDVDDFRLLRTSGAYLALYPAAALQADAGDPPLAGSGFRGVALAANLDSREDVDAAYAEALAAGATSMHAPLAAEWGGYSCYVADPDGHAWELAHNPSWPIGPDGRPQVP